MKIGNVSVTLKNATKDLIIETPEQTWRIISTDNLYTEILPQYTSLRSTKSTADKADIANAILATLQGDSEETPTVEVVPTEKELCEKLDVLLRFFREFDFTPSFRFINTLSHLLEQSTDNAVEYIRNYFALIDNPFTTVIKSKCGSAEFSSVLKTLKYFPPKKSINTRLSIYYGSQGTGKTTIAQEKCDGRCIICNNSMVPADLMEDFVFVDGKPSFKPSALWECMIQGKPIVLDEMNLLPFESLRFLQGLLDGKETFLYKGNAIKVADGFKIIGTMNLVVDGAVFSLPTPLVDRCDDIEEFILSAEQLMNAVL